MATITLDLAEESFQQWRAQRSSRTETIPEELWVMALGLYPRYKISKICHSLRLSWGQFRRRLEDKNHDFSGSGFVLASRGVVNSQLRAEPEVILTLQGKERALVLSIGIGALSQVLPHFETLL